jgi:hypothetical protein
LKPSAAPRPRPPPTEDVGVLDVDVGAALLAALDIFASVDQG